MQRNFDTISGPNVKDTPLSFSPQATVSLSGSAQRRSQSRPEERRRREGEGEGERKRGREKGVERERGI